LKAGGDSRESVMRKEIRLSGFGGQGIILAGHIIGKAAAIYDGKNATLTQSYGPESRGGACSAQLIVSDGAISYPHLIKPEILVVMSQEAYHKHRWEIIPGVILLIDEDLVRPNGPLDGVQVFSIPATRLAEEELGRKMVANIVMLGFFAALTDIVSKDALREAVLSSVPKGTEELNLKAFERGYEVGQQRVISSKQQVASTWGHGPC